MTIVTDSAAGLSATEADAAGLIVVPLTVTIGTRTLADGPDVTALIVQALGDGVPVTTSQPAPAAFTEAYRAAADAGASEIVSIHMSGALSGTVHAAGIASGRSPVPVTVVDSGTAGAAQAWVAVQAARRAREAPELTATQVAAAAVADAQSTRSWGLVDSLDHLRRGGRLRLAASAVGTALGMRPILELRGGSIDVAHVARGRSGAQQRLVRAILAHTQVLDAATVVAQGAADTDIAERVIESVGEAANEAVSAGDLLAEARVLSGALAAHLGPGSVAVAVWPGAADWLNGTQL